MTTTSGRYDPPAFMTDFDGIPGQLEAWSNAMSGWVDEMIAQVQAQLPPGAQCQFYNLVTDPQPGPHLEQDVIWAGFPKMLRVLYGNEGAFELADNKLYPGCRRPWDRSRRDCSDRSRRRSQMGNADRRA